MIAADLAVSWLNAAGRHLDLSGTLGLCLGFAAGALPHRTGILLASAACSGCFGLHFLHLDAFTGAAMCAVSVLQSLTAALCLGAPRRACLVAPVFVATSLMAAALTLATWNGWPSACAALGALLATCARLQVDAQAMRLLFLGTSLCWAVHNLLVGSVFGLTCDGLTLSGLVLALMRESRARSVPAAAMIQGAH